MVPSGNNPWGPHGSTNDFILKGPWDSNTGANNTGVCFRCHSFTNYATAANEGDLAPFRELLDVVTHPFDEQPGRTRYATPAPDGFSDGYMTFCGT